MHENWPLGTHSLGRVESLARSVLGVEGALRHARAVAQIAEDEAAVVTATPHPTGKRDLLADVLGAKLASGAGVHGMDVCGIGIGLAAGNVVICHGFLLMICAAPCRYGRLRTDVPERVDSASQHAKQDTTIYRPDGTARTAI